MYLLIFYSVDSKGVMGMYCGIAEILSGQVIAIPLFPTFLRNIAVLLPFAYIIVAIVLSFFGLPVFVSYIAGLVIILLLGLPNILYLKKNYYTLFMDLEAVN